MSRRVFTVLGILVGLLLVPAAAFAHPLGNFTVNTYSGLRVAPDAVTVDLVVDMAEIPAFQERQSTVDADHDGTVSTVEGRAYGRAACGRLAGQAALTVGGKPYALGVSAASVTFPAGQAGLSTLRLACTLRAAVPLSGATPVAYRLDAYTDRVGWREVTAVGDRATLTGSDVPPASRSHRLTAYPADLLSNPLDVRGATLTARPGGPALAADPVAPVSAEPAARGVDRLTRSFTALVARHDLTVSFGLVATVLAVVLGALHAFAPGHGKTVMAAFLVGRPDEPGGRRRGWRQAASIGLTVTATHTAGVMVLGLALVGSVSVAPQRVYPWLGLASGLLLAAVGATLFRRPTNHHHHHHGAHDHHPAPQRELAAVGAGTGGPVVAPDIDHDIDHDIDGDPGTERDDLAAAPDRHDHPHLHDHSHDHADDHARGHDHGGTSRVGRGRLLTMGLVGGLVPSPSALVVLLGAVALGRTWFGVLLVVAYGAGMAACLVGLGALLARGGRLLRGRRGRMAQRATRVLPVATSLVIVLVGLGLAVQAAAALLG